MTTPTTVLVQLKLRSDTAANWTSANPTLLAGELGRETDTGKIKIGTGSTAWTALAYQPFGAPITNADISATAEIAVSKLADGTARQLLQTDAAGTGVEWASNIDIPGTLDVTGAATFDAAVTVTGDLTVNGTTTNINTTNLVVEDKNIILGDVATPSDVTADGGGITLKGATDKTITWVDATDAWTSSERFSVPLGSTATPSLTITGDGDTGLWSPGANQLAISTNGIERVDWGASEVVFNDGGENYDFRIEGDTNANVFFVDASTDRIGIGTTSPGALVHLSSATGSATPTPTELRIATTTGASDWSVTNPWGRISFYSADTSGVGPKIHAALDVIQGGAAGSSSGFSFKTSSASADTLVERLKIDYLGNVGIGIGTVSPVQPLDVMAIAANSRVLIGDSGISNVPVIKAINSTNTGSRNLGYDAAQHRFYLDGTQVFTIGTDFVFNTGGSERARIDSSGRLLVGTIQPLSTNIAGLSYTSIREQLTGTDGNSSTKLIAQFSNSTNVSSTLAFARSIGTTVGTYDAIASSGVPIGRVTAAGSDGTAFVEGGRIDFVSDGAFGANSAPTRLVFSTTPGGSGTPVERMRISNTGTTTLTSAASTAPFIANIGVTEVVRIDSSGRLLVGTSSAVAASTGPSGALQHQGANSTLANANLGRWTNDNGGYSIYFAKSRGTSVGSHVILSNGDFLGSLFFEGSDGTQLVRSASITANIDGTPGANSMPGRLVLSTTADGASSPTERLRITNDGVMCYDQAAPVSYATAATLVIGDLKNGLIQYTGAAATLTLPTGTLTEGGFSGIYTNMTFEWSVINTGSGTCTIGNGTGHTVTGSATVAAGESARFASRRTAANTFVSYRLS